VATALLLVPLLAAGPARAAEYTMETVARYVVNPAAGEIEVTVEVTFTNTTPNPAGQLSAFDRVDLAIQHEASQVTATDAKGALTVDLETRDGAQVASVRPRARVRYSGSVSFSLSYRLADDAASDVHVRGEVVKFAVWGFGTSSQVTVELPDSYQVRADGDPMLIDDSGSPLRLTSGPIADPSRWLALITASRPSAYATHAASVALASATVDLQVRAWVGDGAWGERTLATLATALPLLEQAIGLPYPRLGPLVVSEALGAEGIDGTPLSPTPEIQLAFDATGFTLLHQAAHVWISDQLASDRWIREGLASHEAAKVAAKLGVALPYDPVLRATEAATGASPLAGWGAQPGSAQGDAYAYAASWAFVDRIATAVGEAHLEKALRRVVAGVSAYDPTNLDPQAPTGLRVAPVDTRRFLDQLAAVSGVDLGDLFGQVVLGPGAGLELAQRGLARDDLDRLVKSAGDWGAPEPIRIAMSSWRFDEARAAMAQASAWLVERDALIAKVATAGLAPSGRLQERFAAGGGNEDAWFELKAERAVVDAYLVLQDRATAPRGPLETIGLFAAHEPGQLLARAAAQFAEGDLQAAAEALDAAELQLNRAPTNGAVRIASGVLLLAVIALVGSLTARRRGGSHYTAAP
jgi:hypothetical protein